MQQHHKNKVSPRCFKLHHEINSWVTRYLITPSFSFLFQNKSQNSPFTIGPEPVQMRPHVFVRDLPIAKPIANPHPIRFPVTFFVSHRNPKVRTVSFDLPVVGGALNWAMIGRHEAYLTFLLFIVWQVDGCCWS